MPHINQLVDKYGKKGLVVVGVTGEGEDPTMKYLEATGWKAIIAFESGLPSMNAYGFSGFPSAALVDAKGKVVWTGHPGGLNDSIIEENLKGAKPPGGQSAFADALKPTFDAPKKYASIAKKIAGGQIGPGLLDVEKALAGKLSDSDQAGLEALKAEVQALYDEEMKSAAEALEGKRYFDARFAWTRLEKAFRGHTLADEPKKKLDELAQDTSLPVEELTAGQEIQKALLLRENGDLPGCVKALERVTSGPLKSTHEAERVAALVDEVKADIEAEKKAKSKAKSKK